MTTKKALIIGLLSIALTGITACAISYTKKTGNSLFKTQATKTDAYNSVTYITTTNIQLEGQPEIYNASFYKNNGVPGITTGTYKINIYKTTTTANSYLVSINIDADGLLWYENNDDTYTEYTFTTGTPDISKQNVQQNTTSQPTSIFIIQEQVLPEQAYYVHTYWKFEINTIDDTYILRCETYGTAGRTLFIDDIYDSYQWEFIPLTETLTRIWGYGNDRYQVGYNEAYPIAYEDGETAGYQEGWNDNTSLNVPVDIRGLMLNVLTMPFTFISQAFDVVLWEGTQYEFHLAGFIKGMIAIAVILFIIRLFTSGFAVLGNYTSKPVDTIQRWKGNRAERKLTKAKTEKIKKDK